MFASGVSLVVYGINELIHYTKEETIVEVKQEEELVYVSDNGRYLWVCCSDCEEEVVDIVVVMIMKRQPKEAQNNDKIVNVKIVKD